MTKTRVLWFIVLPGLSMWLGWGIRGLVGHSTGAMIPGAFAALAFCILLPSKQFSRGLAIALTAVGFGYGADMTTLQSAGLATGYFHNFPNAAVLGYSGLIIKGALWALFGGAGLGLAFTASRYRRKDIILGLIFFVASFFAGWALINRPKLLYFSVDRHETWAGLLFGAVVLLTWLTVRGRTRIPLILALCVAAAGAIGYPIAVTINGYGRHHHPGIWYDWWKVAETTFGFFMGAGLGIGAYLIKGELPEAQETKQTVAQPQFGIGAIILGVALAVLCKMLYERDLPWIWLGSVLIFAAFYSEKLAWHIGVTLTYFACAWDVMLHYWLHVQHIGNATVLWVLAILATLVISWKVTTWWNRTDKAMIRSAYLFLMWSILILTYLMIFINHTLLYPSAEGIAAAGSRWTYTARGWGADSVVEVFFTVAGIVLTWMAYRISNLQETPEHATPSRTSEALT
jgi:hypothetical protein